MPELTDAQLAALTARADAAESAAAAAHDAAARADLAEGALAAGVVRYRDSIAAADARIPADAVTGDTFDAVDQSMSTARRIADAAIAATPTAAHGAPPATPPGASPPRDAAPDTAGMSPSDKVRLGLAQRAAHR